MYCSPYALVPRLSGKWRHRSNHRSLAGRDKPLDSKQRSLTALARINLQAYRLQMDYRDRVAIDPTVRFGKPCVRGTRIAVGDILSYLASGMREEDVLADFPQLTADDIRACLAYAAERERRSVSVPADRANV
jgi:uncharacterized protein (DUF433 family)